MWIHSLPAASQAVVDTVFAVPLRDGLAVATDVATVVLAAVMVGLSLMLLRVLRELDLVVRRSSKGLERSFGPVAKRAEAISDNVEFITAAVRGDVGRLNASVRALTDRLHQASDRMEERIEDFNALMEVVQSEAEDIFLDTASTVRGVREGARSAITGSPRRPSAEGSAATSEHGGHRPEGAGEPQLAPSHDHGHDRRLHVPDRREPEPTSGGDG